MLRQNSISKVNETALLSEIAESKKQLAQAEISLRVEQARLSDSKQITMHKNHDFKSGEENINTSIEDMFLRTEARIDNIILRIKARANAIMKDADIKKDSKSDAAPLSRHFWPPEFNSHRFKQRSMLAVNETTYAFTNEQGSGINFFTFSDQALPKYLGSIPHPGVYCIVMVNKIILASSSKSEVKTFNIEKFLNNTEDAKSAELCTYPTTLPVGLNNYPSENDTLLAFNNRYLIRMVSALKFTKIGTTNYIAVSLIDTKTSSQQNKLDRILLKSRSLINSHIFRTGQLSLLVWKYKTFGSHLKAENYDIDPTQKGWLQPTSSLDYSSSIHHSALNTRPLSAFADTAYMAACITNYTSSKGPLEIQTSSYSPNSKPKNLFTSGFDSMDSFITSTGGVYFTNENKLYYVDKDTNKKEFMAEINKLDGFFLNSDDVLFHFSSKKQNIDCYVAHKSIKEAVALKLNDSLSLPGNDRLPLPKGINNIIADYIGRWSFFPASDTPDHELYIDCNNAIIAIAEEEKTAIDNTIFSLLETSKDDLSKLKKMLQKNRQISIEKYIAQIEINSPHFLKNLQEVQKIIPDLKLPAVLAAKIKLLENTAPANKTL